MAAMLTLDPALVAAADGDLLLDMGCGEGRHALGLTRDLPLRAWALDLDDASLRTAGERYRQSFRPDTAESDPSTELCRFARADINHLPFADATFDLVICSEVLEHLVDCTGAIAEAARVTRPGGTFVVSVPRFVPEWICWKLSSQYPHQPGGHVRIFTTGELKALVRRAGFECYARHWAHGLHSPWWWLQCLLWKNRERSHLVRWYKKFLEWDLMQAPMLTRTLEAVAAPLMGKSLVLYFRRLPDGPGQ